tara:strand:- start:279 stop:452 length:174 start_codon:yes stop_codon:yes gene_type:complete
MKLNKIQIIEKIIFHCKKDDEYLIDIVHEYLQLLEDTELGLKGIKETLEERENKENE